MNFHTKNEILYAKVVFFLWSDLNHFPITS